MVFKRLKRACGENEKVTLPRFLGMAVLVCLLTVFTSTACQKAEQGMEEADESGVLTSEGVISFEGTAEVVQGIYLYVSEAQGFDIVVQGPLSTGDLTSLLDEEVRGEGIFSPDHPSILVANSLEVKDESGTWNRVFTLTGEVTVEGYLSPQARDEYKPLPELVYNKAEDWEGIGKGRIRGKLEEVNGASFIVLYDNRDRETGRIIVDELKDFARYYIKKLGLFDRFWFYLDIKETVDWSTRRKTSELFHADVVFAGLF